MRKFQSFVDLDAPPAQVWVAMRDHMAELAAGMPDVKSITEFKREIFPGLIAVTNEWQVEFPIPAMVRAVLGNGGIAWSSWDRWDERTRVCTWQINPFFLADHLSCEGLTIFEAAKGGAGSRVTIDGSLDLKKGFLGRRAAMAEKLVSGVVENVVSTALPKNMRAVLELAAKFNAGKPAAQAAPTA